MFGRRNIITRNIITDESGATAVEFALIASMLLFSILFVLSVGFTLFLGQSLDSATQKAARQIMLGTVQNASVAQDAFRTGYVCANLPSFFNCNNVIVNVQTVPEARQPAGYFALVNSSQTALLMPASNAAAQYSPGIQQSYEYVQVLYPITFLPTWATQVLSGGTTFNGQAAVMLVSTAAFRNEQY